MLSKQTIFFLIFVRQHVLISVPDILELIYYNTFFYTTTRQHQIHLSTIVYWFSIQIQAHTIRYYYKFYLSLINFTPNIGLVIYFNFFHPPLISRVFAFCRAGVFDHHWISLQRYARRPAAVRPERATR